MCPFFTKVPTGSTSVRAVLSARRRRHVFGAHPAAADDLKLQWNNPFQEGGKKLEEQLIGWRCAYCDSFILKSDYANSTEKQYTKWR